MTVEQMLVVLQLFLAVTLLAALAFAVEVGERPRAEKVLGLAEAARAREQLAGLDAAANERRRIAREAHDIFGHALNIMLPGSLVGLIVGYTAQKHQP